MSRENQNSTNRVALLATGDEITHGDILNTNSQVIAQRLFTNGIQVGIHITAPDNTSEIEQAIDFLLKTHQALIITGGLGPTSDDITRFALSKYLQTPLIFDEAVWEDICNRFKSLGYNEIPESNRQQAMFPEGAIVIPNPNGSAAGCTVENNKHIIFMLPGPPLECLPMIESVVLPTLKQKNFQTISYYENWFLFGISESHIAEKLDKVLKQFDCMTGYRICYPYIEFKIYSNNKKDFTAALPCVREVVKHYLIEDGKQTASELLKQKLTTLDSVLRIRDLATGGSLETIIKTPDTYSHVDFSDHAEPNVIISGLTEFWSNENNNEASLEMKFANGQHIKKKIPFRGARVKQYAVEYICNQILCNLSTKDCTA